MTALMLLKPPTAIDALPARPANLWERFSTNGVTFWPITSPMVFAFSSRGASDLVRLLIVGPISG